MKIHELQSFISVFESKLSSFSFEALSSQEASVLRNSLNNFKQLLELAMAGEKISPNPEQNLEFLKPLSKVHPKGFAKRGFKKDSIKDAKFLAQTGQQFSLPANGIINAANNLLATDLSDDQKAIVNSIQFSSQLILDLSQDILEYSQLGICEEQNESVEFKFYSALRSVLFLCNTLIIGKELKIETDIDPNIPSNLIGEPEKLSQILMNLIGNAIKHTQEGTILVKIKLKEEYLDNLLLEFEICDTSGGIPDADIKHIFNPFKNTSSKNAITPDFSLSVVHSLVQNMNGEIYASSRLGIGTVFTFVLPLKQKSMEKIIYTNRSKSIKGLNILVFEDNDLNQKIIDVKLQKWKCKTFITSNVMKGIKILENNTIDIVLMDIRMPNMNGYDVTNVIRSHASSIINNIPIIAVTADNSELRLEEFLSKGFNDFLIKPYNSEELLQKLIQLNPRENNSEISKLIIETTKINTIDLQPILDDCMGNLELLEELLQLYQQNALEFIGKAKFNLKNENYSELWQCTHKIKAGLAMLGTYGLLEIIVQMENNMRADKDKKHLSFLYNSFVTEYKAVDKEILIAFNRIKK